MIRRTLLKWQSLAYGLGDDQMPEPLANRLAAVARASPLAGRGGGGVLEHGRTALRARGVVGVIAADGCALEILPKIDTPGEDGAAAQGSIRRRLVHMLGVALDLRVDAGRLTPLDWQRQTLLDILIPLFADKLTDAVRRGRPRRYLPHENDLTALRGRLDIGRQFTRLAADPSRLACRFDALTPDIALNQVMRAAVTRLARVARHSDTKRRLAELAFAYADVRDIAVKSLPWHEVVLDRTDGRWRELLGLARLLLGERFQTTSAGTGQGFSLLFEMSALFESYVARLLARALTGSGLRVVAQGGHLHCLTDGERGLFRTKPDILIKRGAETVRILDTKWKRIAARIDDPKQGVSQADVYQMMAYGQLYACPRLTLLYPHHAGLGEQCGVQSEYRITGNGHRLAIATLDVSTAEDMLGRLAELVALAPEDLA